MKYYTPICNFAGPVQGKEEESAFPCVLLLFCPFIGGSFGFVYCPDLCQDEDSVT